MTATVAVSNDGNVPLDVTNVSPAGANTSAYAVNLKFAVVPAGDHAVVAVTLAPNAAGGLNATLAVSHNASARPSNVSLTGTGLAPVANVSAVVHDFGDVGVGVGDVSVASVNVTNDGTATPRRCPSSSRPTRPQRRATRTTVPRRRTSRPACWSVTAGPRHG